jgi:hypothetical protein
MEDDDRPMVDRQLAKALLELVTVGDVRRGVSFARLVRECPDIRLVPAPPLQLVRGCANQDPIRPAVEPLDVAQLGKLSPAADECLLDSILGKIGVPENEPRDDQEAVHLTRGKLSERLPVSLPRSLDEDLPHACRRARADPLTGC